MGMCGVRDSWASHGRVMVHLRLFSRDGVLLATCAQEVSREIHLIRVGGLLLLMIPEGLLLFRGGASDSIARQKL